MKSRQKRFVVVLSRKRHGAIGVRKAKEQSVGDVEYGHSTRIVRLETRMPVPFGIPSWKSQHYKSRNRLKPQSKHPIQSARSQRADQSSLSSKQGACRRSRRFLVVRQRDKRRIQARSRISGSVRAATGVDVGGEAEEAVPVLPCLYWQASDAITTSIIRLIYSLLTTQDLAFSLKAGKIAMLWATGAENNKIPKQKEEREKKRELPTHLPPSSGVMQVDYSMMVGLGNFVKTRWDGAQD
ncbi:hypothetical protein R3P38DRAFT_2760464 [Favolaschia claudopus]|uniref:Uncharacterized protein n=1 Tax=Favolaschia claudopus TaxID=2862362 RepID=A0AAW0DST0_9AGAR